jgi:hypothetical protein
MFDLSAAALSVFFETMESSLSRKLQSYAFAGKGEYLN